MNNVAKTMDSTITTNDFLDEMTSTKFLTFLAITLFYFFETGQMAYYNVLAPAYLHHTVYHHGTIAAISAAYYYGDMIGLFPMGYALDRLPLRVTLSIALIGTILGSFVLFMGDSISIQWCARFICGFFGGTFSFIGGIRVLAVLFPKRFTFYMSIFLAAGMFGAMLCQYPLLLIVNHFGPRSAMFTMFSIGALIAIFCWFFFHPPKQVHHDDDMPKYQGSSWKMFKEIVFNLKNLSDVIMISLLDTPGSIVGTLWGIVLMMNFFHFNASVSSWIVMIMFAGFLLGLPTWGNIADKKGVPTWIVTLGAGVSFLLVLGLLLIQSLNNPWLVSLLFFGLGFFSSCQTIGFTWVTKNMKPELIGRNSAFNSMVFMGINGGFKQIGAILLMVPALFLGNSSATNLLLIILSAMLLATIYSAFRKLIFRKGF